MVERFNGRVQREVLGITIANHRDLETVLRSFNAAYNRRCQRVLKGLSPEMVLRQRLEADPTLVNPAYTPLKPGILRKALQIVADAKEVSQPDSKGRRVERRPIEREIPGDVESRGSMANGDLSGSHCQL